MLPTHLRHRRVAVSSISWLARVFPVLPLSISQSPARGRFAQLYAEYF